MYAVWVGFIYFFTAEKEGLLILCPYKM